jgi:hypothetical protein
MEEASATHDAMPNAPEASHPPNLLPSGLDDYCSDDKMPSLTGDELDSFEALLNPLSNTVAVNGIALSSCTPARPPMTPPGNANSDGQKETTKQLTQIEQTSTATSDPPPAQSNLGRFSAYMRCYTDQHNSKIAAQNAAALASVALSQATAAARKGKVAGGRNAKDFPNLDAVDWTYDEQPSPLKPIQAHEAEKSAEGRRHGVYTNGEGLLDALEDAIIEQDAPSLRNIPGAIYANSSQLLSHQQNSTSPSVDLDILTPEQRTEEYSDSFNGETPIAQLQVPSLAHQYPHLEEEIGQAYLRYHHFIFRIKVNYDEISGWFFDDERRWQDCGKLVFTPKALAHLRSLNAHKVLYPNVILEITTPFRILALISAEVRSCRLDVRPVIDTFVNHKLRGPAVLNKHAPFRNYVKQVADKISSSKADVTNGQPGFTFKDLEKVAQWFALTPTEQEDLERWSWTYNGPWSPKRYEGFEGVAV